ncbi:hypothetical protein [Sporisorium scitamineum]|nr:hypothetical protein [Sporisorium scitamineum]
MLLEGQGRLSQAIELYDDALAKEQTSLILSRRRIAAIKSTGDTKRTLEALNAHLDTFYNDPEAWQELAEVYASQGLYAQSAFALEEVLLQIPQNNFFHLKYAETLYTNGDVVKAFKAYLRVLELCQSDGGATEEQSVSKQSVAQGPWLRALWGTKIATIALIATPPASWKNSTTEDTVDQAKVKKIDELVTNLLLNKVYTPQAVSAKHLRDVARAVLAA